MVVDWYNMLLYVFGKIVEHCKEFLNCEVLWKVMFVILHMVQMKKR